MGRYAKSFHPKTVTGRRSVSLLRERPGTMSCLLASNAKHADNPFAFTQRRITAQADTGNPSKSFSILPEARRQSGLGRIRSFVTVRDFSRLAICYAQPNGRVRPQAAARQVEFADLSAFAWPTYERASATCRRGASSAYGECGRRQPDFDHGKPAFWLISV